MATIGAGFSRMHRRTRTTYMAEVEIERATPEWVQVTIRRNADGQRIRVTFGATEIANMHEAIEKAEG